MRLLKGLVLVSVILFSVTSCNKKNNNNNTGEVKTTENLVSVKLLTDNAGIDDKSFNASAWRGIERFYHNASLYGSKYTNILCSTNDQFLPTLRLATDDAPDLIIASGFLWVDAIDRVAKDYPDQKYMLIDAKSKASSNVVSAIFEEETGSYLVGVIAANQAKSEGIINPKFGFIGGVPNGTLTRFEIGYVQGIRSVFPNAEIVDYYANSFSAPELGKVQAKNFYDQGVYCIFTAAGATGSGAIAQAKEYRLQGRKIWIIGVDSDQYEDGIYNDNGDSVVLTSMLKLVENATFTVLNELQNGKFISGERKFDLAMDCVGYSISNAALKEAVVAAAEAARVDIISGKIEVAKTYKDAKAKGLAPLGLRAIDD